MKPSNRMGLPCLCLSTSEDHYVHMRYIHVLVAYALSLYSFCQRVCKVLLGWQLHML